MKDSENLVKLTFHKPITMERWSNWEIVVDSLPVADFGEPENNTLKLSEGTHEIYLRHQVMRGVSSATQKLRVTLAKGDDVTIKLGIDPKVHLFVLFCIVMTLMNFPPEQESLKHMVQLGCFGIMMGTFFSLVKGFSYRLCIVEPKHLLSSTDTEISAQKKEVKADLVVQSLAADFEKNAATRKAPRAIGASQISERFSGWTFYLMIVGLLTFDMPPPVDAIATVSLVISAITCLIGSSWTRDRLLKNISSSIFLLGSLIGLTVAFGPPLGNLAQTVFLLLGLCMSVSLSLSLGLSIAESMSRSKAAGILTMLLNSALAAVFVYVMVPSLLKFVAQHM